jgi:hypothetical protein
MIAVKAASFATAASVTMICVLGPSPLPALPVALFVTDAIFFSFYLKWSLHTL